MSLWHKPVELVTFDDIEAFCQLGYTEGPRLDYKAEIPNKLHKVVAAFANSLGGLIVLGIEADKATNKPAWPPRGMKKAPGIEERITAICRDNIYPPVCPKSAPSFRTPTMPGRPCASFEWTKARKHLTPWMDTSMNEPAARATVLITPGSTGSVTSSRGGAGLRRSDVILSQKSSSERCTSWWRSVFVSARKPHWSDPRPRSRPARVAPAGPRLFRFTPGGIFASHDYAMTR